MKSEIPSFRQESVPKRLFSGTHFYFNSPHNENSFSEKPVAQLKTHDIQGQTLVEDLFQKVKDGSEDFSQALEELSGIAMGGNIQARRFIHEIDDTVPTVKLLLPLEKIPESDKVTITKKIADILYISTHPLLSLRTARRRLFVSLDIENPPTNSTIEGFYMSPLADAAKLLRKAEKNENSGGVPKSAWSKADQIRLEKGEKPLGYPNHPNV